MRINVRNDTRDMQKKVRIRTNIDLPISSNISNYLLCTSTDCPFVSVSLSLIEFHACPFDHALFLRNNFPKSIIQRV